MPIALCELNNYAYVHYKERKGGEERERERERRGRGYKYMHKQMLDTHVPYLTSHSVPSSLVPII